jgi:hypothetical protein
MSGNINMSNKNFNNSNIDILDDENHYDAIGMNGGSGHSRCDMCKFNCATFGAFVAAYFVGNLGVVLSTVFRVDAGIVLGFTVMLRLWSMSMGPCLGCMHDGEVLQPVFEKCGCSRKKCGRRAPHLFYSIPISIICTFLSFRMPSMATMTITPMSDAKLYDSTQTKWFNSTYRTWKRDRWSDSKSFHNGPLGYTDTINGMPCGEQLQITLNDGTIYTFNDTKRTPEEYGQDICTSLMGATSVCWPGPTGAPNVGDNNPRVCALMNQPSLIAWFFTIAFINRLGYESM